MMLKTLGPGIYVSDTSGRCFEELSIEYCAETEIRWLVDIDSGETFLYAKELVPAWRESK